MTKFIVNKKVIYGKLLPHSSEFGILNEEIPSISIVN